MLIQKNNNHTTNFDKMIKHYSNVST